MRPFDINNPWTNVEIDEETRDLLASAKIKKHDRWSIFMTLTLLIATAQGYFKGMPSASEGFEVVAAILAYTSIGALISWVSFEFALATIWKSDPQARLESLKSIEHSEIIFLIKLTNANPKISSFVDLVMDRKREVTKLEFRYLLNLTHNSTK